MWFIVLLFNQLQACIYIIGSYIRFKEWRKKRQNQRKILPLSATWLIVQICCTCSALAQWQTGKKGVVVGRGGWDQETINFDWAKANAETAGAPGNHTHHWVFYRGKYECNWVHPLHPELFWRTGSNEYRACRICLRKLISHNSHFTRHTSSSSSSSSSSLQRPFPKINSWLNIPLFLVSPTGATIPVPLRSMHKSTNTCQAIVKATDNALTVILYLKKSYVY